MFDFHNERKWYFDMQTLNAETYVLPFIEEKFPITPGMRVLEIGCGEGGVIKAFVKRGLTGVAVELSSGKFKMASEWLSEYISSKQINLISSNIYDTSVEALGGTFDIIVLKDVIEHIHDQAKIMAYMATLLNPGGIIFFGFPPWHMPFGGHQQICHGKWMSRLPYYHLLPMPIYKWFLRIMGEGPNVAGLAEIKETGITIERFERIAKQTNFEILHHRHYLINPIYEYKFKLKPRVQFGFIKALPWIRNFFTTCVYYTLRQK